MSDSSDRLVEPVDEYGPDPFAEATQVRSGERRVRVDGDEGFILDAEGRPVAELDVETPDEIAQRGATVRQLAVDERVWQFGHVIVDEAQDLTPMQWRMVVRRSQGRSVTMLGDLAQRSAGEPGRWQDHLPPEFAGFEQRNLTTNYRSPAEINELAAEVLATLVPDLPSSRAVRRAGHHPVVIGVDDLAAELPGVVTGVAAEAEAAGGAEPAVIGHDLPALPVGRVLAPVTAKGLEFDSVVVVEPARFLDEPGGLSLLYVALTRSTDRLTIVHHRPLPELLATALSAGGAG
ncbi:MAG: ATP-binding domain-containing protein [Actinomycetota bacterium]